MSGIVISYRREDTEGSAGRLYDRLVVRYGDDFVFMDHNSIAPAQDWLRTIDDTISRSNVVIALIGPRWISAENHEGRRRLDLDDDYVRREIRLALDSGTQVLPVLVQGAAMVSARSLPADIGRLSDIQPAHLDSRHYNRDVDQLFRLIDIQLGFGTEIHRWDNHATAIAAFVGLASSGPINQPVLLRSWEQFTHNFGQQAGFYLSHAVYGWFANGGRDCWVVRVGEVEGAVSMTDFNDGIACLEMVKEATIVAAPDIVGLYQRSIFDVAAVWATQLDLIVHCERMGNRVAILDLPLESTPNGAVGFFESSHIDSPQAAAYYPWVRVMDPASGLFISVPPSGHIAGTWARNDTERGVWVPPANIPLAGVVDLSKILSSHELAFIHDSSRVNALRAADDGMRVWRARSMAKELRYKDIALVRLIGALGSFVVKATSWAAFEPSNVRIWHRLQTNVDIILQMLWERGAFQGQRREDAFYAICNEELNPAELVAQGKLHIDFGFTHASVQGWVQLRVEQPSGDIMLFGN